jgi:Terminase small subunit
METPAPASTDLASAVKPRQAVSTRPRLTSRQEAFCHAMACNVGGAEAARRAGYSASGAKQRGAFLMRQPEIRVRVDEIRRARQADHQAQLDEAAEQVGRVIEVAFETGRSGLALRAIEFRLKLRGVIQDKRIAHHYVGCLDRQPHPDADLETLDCDPDEELDPVRFLPGYIPEPAAQLAAKGADATPAVTESDLPALSAPAFQPQVPAGRMTYIDLSRKIEKMTSDFSSLLESTALTSPANSLEGPSSTGPMCRA